MSMKIKNLSQFHLSIQAFIQKEKLLNPDEAVICAISGGVDSMVLGTILHELGYCVIVAHFNFKLRGLESDEDEAFVKNWAEERNLPFYLGALPEPDFWENEGKDKNIQLEARRLRYQWLNELKNKTGAAAVATGHHAGDQEETILMNFFRGSGISGLRGILPVSNGIIRPLLTSQKADILDFARKHVGHWRNDSSNETDKYKRNEIRHHLIPVIKSAFPGFQPVIQRNIERFRILEEELSRRFGHLQLEFCKLESSDSQEFDFEAIKSHESGSFFLSELIRKNGLDYDQLDEWCNLPPSMESRIWSKGNIEIEIKGKRLIVNKKKEIDEPLKITISETGTFPILGAETTYLFVSRIKKSTEFTSIDNQEACYVDASKIRFPLTLESWQAGDRMKPFGMKGKSKLVSDLLTEKGLSQLEKKRILVLRDSTGEILWVIGIRNSELAKITKSTDEMFVLVYQSDSNFSS